MGNGIFLATAVVDGKPTLFQYTMRPDDPVVIVERYKPTKEDLIPRPVDMSTAFGHNLVNPDAARRLVERVAEDAVVVKINPLNYPEPLRQHILSTPHLERGVDDAES
jgi:hypothetical protein